jgi:curved DNA-binding protein CbpA
LATTSQTGSRRGNPNGTGPDPDEEDHYALLGVPFTASHAEITRAYRRAMKRAHPDRQRPDRRAASEELARRLNAAYATLSDPIKRQAYDRTIRQQVIQDQIMQRYVGGFQTFESRAASPHAPRPQPTAAERKERAAANRQASFTLVIYAAAVTAIILIGLLVASLLGSALQAVR